MSPTSLYFCSAGFGQVVRIYLLNKALNKVGEEIQLQDRQYINTDIINEEIKCCSTAQTTVAQQNSTLVLEKCILIVNVPLSN